MGAVKSSKADFRDELAAKAEIANNALARILQEQGDIHTVLRAAMEYTLSAPGKRLRGALVLWSCELIAGQVNAEAKTAAAAVEMVHTYSLVHDDLPAMDDDDMRRGRASCHRKFDEATAILAGDALLTLAFEVLASEIDDSRTAVKLIRELASAAGPAGMVGGQMADLDVEKRAGDEEILNYIHTNKTAKMFRAAAGMGGICGGASERQYERLCEYGLKIGLGFQIADDILDISGSSEHLGKTAGKDAQQGKITYPAVMGMKKSRAAAGKFADEAVEALACFGRKADILRALSVVLLERTR